MKHTSRKSVIEKSIKTPFDLNSYSKSVMSGKSITAKSKRTQTHAATGKKLNMSSNILK